MNAGALKWLSIALDVLTYEAQHTNDGQLLSEVCDELIEKHPVLARAGIVVVGGLLIAHLANLLPWEYDVMSIRFWRRVREALKDF